MDRDGKPGIAQGQGMLEGVRIIDLTTVVFGPYATQLLADMGAEVIKVEALSGDAMRHMGRSAKTRRMAAPHFLLNRGKRSVALDLKTPEDAEVMTALLKSADVFIHNVREKPIEKLGFGYDAVKAINPGIIYAHCVGFGSDGPYAGLQAYDDVIQAASGTASLLPRVDGNPAPRYFPSLIADKVAGLYATQAVLAAVVHKLRTGKGQHIEIPMFESFSHFMLLEHMYGAVFDPPTAPAGYPRQIEPRRQPFPTKDGYISIVPYTADAFVRLFQVLGAPEFLNDEKFATARAQTENINLMYAEVARLTPAKTTAEWLDVLSAAQLPAMKVADVQDMLDDPHLKAVNFFRKREHATEGGYYEMPLPTVFSDAARRELSPPPGLGEHSDEIRAEAKSRG